MVHLLLYFSLSDKPNKNDTNPHPDTYMGDLWFTSMYVVEYVSDCHIGNLKINSNRYTKTFFHQTMKDWPSCSYLNLNTILNSGSIKECTVYTMGYEYRLLKSYSFPTIICLWSKVEGYKYKYSSSEGWYTLCNLPVLL